MLGLITLTLCEFDHLAHEAGLTFGAECLQLTNGPMCS
jgi:hypothetical protein